MDNIESVMGKIQSMDSLLFEFNLSELNINSKVFIYEGTLLDENSETILSDNIYASGGGRKNKFLLSRLGKILGKKIKLIDELNIEGDFVESQAFAYIAIRSYLGELISFPETTGCSKACSGGVLIKPT